MVNLPVRMLRPGVVHRRSQSNLGTLLAVVLPLLLCIFLLSTRLLEGDVSGDREASAINAFVTPRLPHTTPNEPMRTLVVREVGRSWKNPKKNFAAQQGPQSFGGKKKKGEEKKPVDTTPPPIHRDSPVIYNGKVVANLNGTISEYKVDIWSGAHPIWQGKKGKVLLDASSVTKFQEKWGAASDIYGEAGLDQLKANEEKKKELAARKAAGFKVY